LAIRHKSAIKRHRQDLKREERNRAVRTRTRHVVRELRETIASGDADSAATKLREVVQTLSKAATKGVLHRNSASRRIARLSRQVQALKS
jgi:small subunit ribosomal protein S20